MTWAPFTLADFITESNRIEGEGPANDCEVEAHIHLLNQPKLTVDELIRFVDIIAGAELREHPGMNVFVGNYRPPAGGPPVRDRLEKLLDSINEGWLTPLKAHKEYEDLHPFMDGNGRSGRAIWLWMMGGIDLAPLGFLHTWYYQTLDTDEF